MAEKTIIKEFPTITRPRPQDKVLPREQIEKMRIAARMRRALNKKGTSPETRAKISKTAILNNKIRGRGKAPPKIPQLQGREILY